MGETSTGGGPKVSLANPITGKEGALPALKIRGGFTFLTCAARARGKVPEESWGQAGPCSRAGE